MERDSFLDDMLLLWGSFHKWRKKDGSRICFEYYKHLKHISYRDWNSILKILNKDCVKFPKIEEILEIAKKVKYTNEIVCPECSNTGWVIIKKYKRGMEYTYCGRCCYCEYGKKANKNIKMVKRGKYDWK